MRLGLVSTYAPRRHELAGPATALVRELIRRHEVCVCAVDRHGLEYPDEVSAVITDDRPDDYVRAARILDDHGVDAVLIEYDEGIYGGPGGAHVSALVEQLRARSVATIVRLHALPQTGRDSGRVAAGLVEAASAVLVPSAYAAGLVVGRVAGAQRVVVVPSPTLTPDAGGPASSGPLARNLDARSTGGGRTLTVLGALRPERGLERTLHGVAKVAADHPDVRLILGETSFPESTQDEREAYLDHLWAVAHDLGVTDRVTILAERLGPADRAAVLDRTTALLVPWLPADRPAFGVFAEAMSAGCALVSTRHPYATEMLASGAGLLLPDDEPEGLAEAVGRLLTDTARLAQARRSARAEATRFAGPAVAQRVVEVVESLGDRPQRILPLTVAVHVDDLHREVTDRHELAHLGLVAAALAGAGATVVAIPEWRASVEWSRRALAGLVAPDPGEAAEVDGWSIRALAALSGPGLAPAVRDRARAHLARRWAGPASVDHGSQLRVDDAALIVLGLRTPGGPLWSAAVRRLTAAGPTSGPAWPWPAERITGEAARLPHALIVAGTATGDAQLAGQGARALDWYVRRVGLGDVDGVFTLPGGESATAVGAAVEALAEAYRVTGARRFGRFALRAFAWFAGANRAGEPAYEAGRCRERVGGAAPAPVTVCATLAHLGAAVALRDAGLATLSAYRGTLVSPGAR